MSNVNVVNEELLGKMVNKYFQYMSFVYAVYPIVVTILLVAIFVVLQKVQVEFNKLNLMLELSIAEEDKKNDFLEETRKSISFEKYEESKNNDKKED